MAKSRASVNTSKKREMHPPHIDIITNSRYVSVQLCSSINDVTSMYEMNTKSNLIEIYDEFNKILSLS